MSRRARRGVNGCAIILGFVSCVCFAIWLPDVMVAQRLRSPDEFDREWRANAAEHRLDSLELRVDKQETRMSDDEVLRDTVHRNQSEIKGLQDSVERQKRMEAMLDMLRWEATIGCALFAGLMGWLIRWLGRQVRTWKVEIIRARRDAREARHHDFKLIGQVVVKLTEESGHVDLAEELTRAMHRKDRVSLGLLDEEDAVLTK